MARYATLKNELKQLAVEIHNSKISFKEMQRTGKDTWKFRPIVEGLIKDCRHKHIAYSMLRGHTYEQIEGKVRKGNEPDMEKVKSLMEEHAALQAKEDAAYEALRVGT